MQNYHHPSAMIENSSYMQSLIKNEVGLPQNYFTPFSSEHTRGSYVASTPQRFLLPTTLESFVSPRFPTTPSGSGVDLHTVPQSLDHATLNQNNNTSDNMFMDEYSSSRSYSPDSSSEGELCIDETISSSLTEGDHETHVQEEHRTIMSISPAIQFNLLDRYKIPNQIPMVYHKNMAREFPEAHGKTEQQKLQRKKNTEAARQSRAKAKVLETIVESECRQAATENINAKRMIATQRSYANTLLQLIGTDEVDWSTKWKEHEMKYSRCEL